MQGGSLYHFYDGLSKVFIRDPKNIDNNYTWYVSYCVLLQMKHKNLQIKLTMYNVEKKYFYIDSQNIYINHI